MKVNAETTPSARSMNFIGVRAPRARVTYLLSSITAFDTSSPLNNNQSPNDFGLAHTFLTSA